MQTLHYWQAIVCGLLALSHLSGAVVFQATFGHPLIYSDRIVFTSVDGKNLIGIDKKGNQRWEIHFSQRININRWNDKGLLVQSGKEVLQVDVQQGTQSKLVTMPGFQLLYVDGEDHSFAAAFDSRFDHHGVQILDSTHYTAVWESSTIEEILQVTPDTIVAVTADRLIKARGSYQTKNAAIRGYNRSDGRVRWSLALSISDTGLVASAASDHFLAVAER